MAWVVTAVAAALEVGATAAVIATAVTEVGIAMTVVGTITKSKELVKIGGVLSIAGGVGSLAVSAGLIGSTAAAEGVAGVAPGAAAGAYSDVAGEQFAQSMGMDAAGSGFNAATNVANLADGAVQTFGIPDPSGAANAAGDGLKTQFGDAAPPIDMPANAASKAGDVSSAATPSAPAGLNAQATAPAASDTASTIQGAVDDAMGAAPKPGIGQSIKDWYGALSKDQQSRVGTALLQAGGSAVGGLFNGWSVAQKAELENEGFQLQKQRYADSVANANAQPKIAFKPTGLINSTAGG